MPTSFVCRLDLQLLAAGVLNSEAPVRYNIVVADKHADKPALVAKIAAAGGRVDDLHFGSILIDATLTGSQLLLVAGCNEVLWIDRWSAAEIDMDNGRIQGGGNYVETQAGYTGTGVSAHVYEGVESTHPDFTGGVTNVQSGGAAEQHGHATGGIVWGAMPSCAVWRPTAPSSTPTTIR